MSALCFFLVLGGCSFRQRGSDEHLTASNALIGENESGAIEYGRWLLQFIDDMKMDIYKLVPSAEKAAAFHVLEGRYIGADGERSIISELTGRSGGMMRFRGITGSRVPSGPGVILYFLRPGMKNQDEERIKFHKEVGSLVILFGSRELIADILSTGIEIDDIIVNNVPDGGGFYMSEKGNYYIPMHKPANVAIAWAWMGEFLAACTRIGKMPLVYEGFLAKGGLQYAQRHIYVFGYDLRDIDFYRGEPEHVQPGFAGETYIGMLRLKIERLIREETGTIRAVGWEAAARLSGRKEGAVYASLFGHSVQQRAPVAFDPGYFQPLDIRGPEDFVDKIDIQSGDMLLCIGYNFPARFTAEDIRPYGALTAWSIAGMLPDQLDAIQEGEYFIDQHWSYGDAVVSFPGLEINILPASGFLAEAVLWMTAAEVYKYLENQQQAKDPFEMIGRGPLFKAVMDNDIGEMRKILARGVDFSNRDSKGLSPLHSACRLGHADAARLLLDSGASPSVPDYYGRTPLHIACAHGFHEIVKTLLMFRGAAQIRDINGETALHRASRGGYSDIVRVLAGYDASIVNIRCNMGRTALHTAAGAGKTDVVECLIDMGAVLEERDKYGMQPVHFAAESGGVNTVRIPLEGGAEIDCRDRWGRNPLHWAASRNDVEVVRELLLSGADPNAPDLYGRTPLFDASNSDLRHSTYDVVTFLLQNGADPMIRCNNGRYAYHGSTRRIRDLLLEYMD